MSRNNEFVAVTYFDTIILTRSSEEIPFNKSVIFNAIKIHVVYSLSSYLSEYLPFTFYIFLWRGERSYLPGYIYSSKLRFPKAETPK